MSMNTGYRCPCGSRRTYASLIKLGDTIEVVLRCNKCGAEVGSDVNFLTDDDWDFSRKEEK